MNYWLLLYPLLIIILVFLNQLSEGKLDKTLTWVLIIVFSLICGFRNFNSGYDTEGYINLFDNLNSLQDIFFGYMSWKGDYFFTLITLVLKKIGANGRYFLLILSFISVSILIKGLKKLFEGNKDSFLLISLFYSTTIPFLLFGNVIRQGLAISLFLYGLSQYHANRKSYYLFLILSILSHKSALIFVLFQIFEIVKWNFKYVKILLVGFGIKAFVIIGLLAIPFIRSKYFFYSNNFNEQENIFQILFFTLVVIFTLNKKLVSVQIENNLIFNYFFFVTITSLIFLEIPKISGRLFLWTAPILPYIFLRSFEHYKQHKALKYIFSTIVIIGSFWLMLSNQIQTNIQY